MDGVTEFFPPSNGSNSPTGSRYSVEVFPDPTFEPFDGVKTYVVDSDASLEINGANLTLAAFASEYDVTIGEEVCTVRTVDTNILYCTPPRKKESDTNGRYAVVVSTRALFS